MAYNEKKIDPKKASILKTIQHQQLKITYEIGN